MQAIHARTHTAAHAPHAGHAGAEATQPLARPQLKIRSLALPPAAAVAAAAAPVRPPPAARHSKLSLASQLVATDTT